ncbi:MAG: YraN family protein [Candidatus Saganbacteria bacterium]|nr:YraN family protein [Candidatus Saganbacteria bacterium]
MGMDSYEKGKIGEEIARVYLEGRGFRIVEHNFHSQQGEVDLIAYHKSFLVFIEVKNYSYKSWGSPFGSITKNKRRSIIHAARTYLYRNKIKNINSRFDVLSIYHKRDGSHQIDHLENAFFVN